MKLITGKRYRVTDCTGNSLICQSIDAYTLQLVPSYFAGRLDIGWARINVEAEGRDLKIEQMEDRVNG